MCAEPKIPSGAPSVAIHGLNLPLSSRRDSRLAYQFSVWPKSTNFGEVLKDPNGAAPCFGGCRQAPIFRPNLKK